MGGKVFSHQIESILRTTANSNNDGDNSMVMVTTNTNTTITSELPDYNSDEIIDFDD